jgi:hypothetical protein
VTRSHLPHLGSPLRRPGSMLLDREPRGAESVATVICRPQAARSGEPAPPNAVLLSRLSLQRSMLGVWPLHAGIRMSVPPWRWLPSLFPRQHLEAAAPERCGARHSGHKFCSGRAVRQRRHFTARVSGLPGGPVRCPELRRCRESDTGTQSGLGLRPTSAT